MICNKKIEDLIKERVLIIDGAMGTQLQAVDIESKFWQYENKDLEGCNELLKSYSSSYFRDNL